MTLPSRRYLPLALAAVLAAAAAQGAEPAAARPPLLTMRGGADPRIQQGIDLIYNLRFDEADRYFAGIIAADPDNPVGHFFLAMVTWWRVLADLYDRSHDEAFYALLQRCIDVCDRRLAQDPNDFDAILFEGGAIGFRARLRGDRHDFVRAARDGLRCLPLLEKSEQLEPTNKDILFGQGIYNYFAAVIPQQYPVVRPVMLFLDAGDRDLGLQQLEAVAREGRYARAEAKYFLAQIHRLFEHDDAGALPYLQELHDQYPGNALFHRYLASTLIAANRWPEGVALYEQVARHSRAGEAGYHRRGHLEALYYIGKSAFRDRRLKAAAAALSAADSLSRTLGQDPETQGAGGFAALANLYLGLTYAELGRPDDALASYDRVLALPAYGKSHDLARSYRQDVVRGGRPQPGS